MNAFEIEILKFLSSFRNDFLNKLFEYISKIGEGPVIFALILTFYFIINKKTAKELFFAFSISHIFNGVIKNFVRRPRPWVYDESFESIYKDTATGYSFPSGHSQTISTITSSLATKLKKNWMTIVAIIVSLLVGLSRLFLGVHYPSDVLVGLVLGTIFGIGTILVLKNKSFNKVVQISIACCIPFAILFLFFNDQYMADFYKTLGLLICGYLGMLFEEKYVKFEINGSLGRRIVRLAIAGVIAGGTYLVLSLKPIKSITLTWDGYLQCLYGFLKYGLLGFLGFGFSPFVLKKLNLN